MVSPYSDEFLRPSKPAVLGRNLQAGPRYVPLLRVSLLQLEMVLEGIHNGIAIQRQSNKVMDEADKETMAAKRVSRAMLAVCAYTHMTAP